jgi:hypothetical protein
MSLAASTRRPILPVPKRLNNSQNRYSIQAFSKRTLKNDQLYLIDGTISHIISGIVVDFALMAANL